MQNTFPLISLTPTERDVLIAFHSVDSIGQKTLLRLFAIQKKLHVSFEEIWRSEKLWEMARFSHKQEESLRMFKKLQTPAIYAEKLAAKDIATILYMDDEYS